MAENIYSCFHYHKKCQEDRQAIEALAPKVMEAAEKAVYGVIGDIKYTTRTTAPNGGVWCDGATYSKADFTYVHNLLTKGKLQCVDIATYNNVVSLNGSCGLFGFDANSESFRVPLLKDVYLKAGQEAETFGAESLPQHTHTRGTMNITGTLPTDSGGASSRTGAFYAAGSAGGASGSSGNNNLTGFDASRSWTGETSGASGATYKSGAKVNPDHVKYRAYVVLYTAEKELSIVNWTNQLQRKTDDGVATLNNLANTYSKEIGYLSGTTSNIQTQLNGKANADADNFSANGKAAIAGLGMPSTKYTTLTAGATASTYVAPANGYFTARYASKAGVICFHNNNTRIISGNDTGANLPHGAYIHAKKGETVVLHYNNGTPEHFYFVYAGVDA